MSMLTFSVEVLSFSDIDKSSAGHYTCVASLSQGASPTPSVEIINATITVTVGVSPVITSTPEDVTVMQGEDAAVYCAASGDPLPNIKWDRDGQILNTSQGSHYQVCITQINMYAHAP